LKLIITEKDTAAKRIAHILSQGGFKVEKSTPVPIYVYREDGEEVKCLGLKGHILKVDYPKEYNNWQEVDPKELIDAEIVKVPLQKEVIKVLQKLGREAKMVTISTDFDREGEVIGVDALNKIREVNPGIKVKRARFSALTKAEIEKAFSNLEEIYLNLAASGEARQDIDLIWGATLTRFLSLASSRLGRQFLSVGRVQSPTLALIAEREKERQVFIPQPYWQLKVLLESQGQTFEARHRTERFWKEEEAEAARAKVDQAMSLEAGLVTGVSAKERSLTPPAPFNTTAFLSAAAFSLGLSTSKAMRLAENLYINGLISYPRVDNTVYPDSMNFREHLSGLLGGEFDGLILEVLKQDKLTPTRGKKFATDHPPIHPTDVAKRNELDPQEWKIYELVLRRFLSTLAQEAIMESIRVDIEINGEPFLARGHHILKEGWLKFYPYGRKKEVELPDLREGDKLRLVKNELERKETQPPPRYSQGELIRLMEKIGLGTKSTRHLIIQNLYQRRYVHGDPLIPTETGLAVAESLMKHAQAISTPEMTAKLEEDMDAIAEGKMAKVEVVSESRSMLKKVLGTLEKRKEQLAKEIREGIQEDRIIGSCPKCGQELRVIRSKKTKKRFIGCTNYPECSQSYPLPQKGEVISLGEVCEVCGAPKIKVISKRSRPWILCVDSACPSKEGKGQESEGRRQNINDQ